MQNFCNFFAHLAELSTFPIRGVNRDKLDIARSIDLRALAVLGSPCVV